MYSTNWYQALSMWQALNAWGFMTNKQVTFCCLAIYILVREIGGRNEAVYRTMDGSSLA
jgi:hypothetical protein